MRDLDSGNLAVADAGDGLEHLDDGSLEMKVFLRCLSTWGIVPTESELSNDSRSRLKQGLTALNVKVEDLAEIDALQQFHEPLLRPGEH